MSLFYLDASALVKRYRTEAGSEVIDYLFDNSTDDDQLAASFLVVIELTGLGIRLRRNRSITARGLSALLARFHDDQVSSLELFPISQVIQGIAVRIAHTYGLRAADSIHLATMVELERAAQSSGIGFLAMIADRSFLDAAEKEGIRVINPESDAAMSQVRELVG